MVDGRGPVDGPVLVIGTRKGAWLLSGDAARGSLARAEPMFLGHIVQHVVIDPRDRARCCSAPAPGTSARPSSARTISGGPGTRRAAPGVPRG